MRLHSSGSQWKPYNTTEAHHIIVLMMEVKIWGGKKKKKEGVFISILACIKGKRTGKPIETYVEQGRS